MKRFTLSITAVFFAVVSMTAQEKATEKEGTSVKKADAKEMTIKIESVESDAATKIVTKKKSANVDADEATSNAATKGPSALEKMKAERDAKAKKKQDALLAKMKKEGAVIDTKEQERRKKMALAQKKKFEERKAKQAKKQVKKGN